MVELLRLVEFLHVLHTPEESVDDSKVVGGDVADPRTGEEPTLLPRLPLILKLDPVLLRLDRLGGLVPVSTEDRRHRLAVDGRGGGVIGSDVVQLTADEVAEVRVVQAFHRVTYGRKRPLASSAKHDEEERKTDLEAKW